MARSDVLFILGLFSTAILSVKANICWHPKRFNSLTPSAGGSVDGEQIPKGAELAKICPTGNTSNLAIRCYDDRDNLFTGTQNITCRHAPGSYLLTCDAGHGGMLCAPHDGGSNCTCPDYSAQFGCECAPGMSGIKTQTSTAAVLGEPGVKTQTSTAAVLGEPDGSRNGSGQLRSLAGWTSVAAVLAMLTWIL